MSSLGFHDWRSYILFLGRLIKTEDRQACQIAGSGSHDSAELEEDVPCAVTAVPRCKIIGEVMKIRKFLIRRF